MLRIEIAQIVERSPSRVYRFVREPGAVAALQPFIVSIEHEPRPPYATPETPYSFRAVEVVPFIPRLSRRWGIRTRMTVKQTNDDLHERIVTFEITARGPGLLGGLASMAGVQSFTFEPVEVGGPGTRATHTRVIDRFEIHSYPGLLGAFVKKSAEAAHRVLMQRLKAKLEGTPQ